MDMPPFLLRPPEPQLLIEREPKKRGYRFRYSSEGQTHGGIPGEPDKQSDSKKCHPTIKLLHHNGPAKVVVTLVTADEPYNLHAHSLIVNKEMTKGYHVFEMQENKTRLELKSIAIQHVVKEGLTNTLMDRILQSSFILNFGWNSGINSTGHEMFDVSEYVRRLTDGAEDQFVDRATAERVAGVELERLKVGAEELGKKMQMGACRLCFQAFLKDDTNGKYTRVLDPVYSDIIYDGKTKQGATLKIIRLSKVSCSVKGDDEVWLLADKLNPEDIEVRFFEDQGYAGLHRRPWEDFGRFNKTDIYKQVCLIFKTPPYHDLNIQQPANVKIQLRRKMDKSCCSEPLDFKYTPIVYDRYGIGEKRKKEIPNVDTLFNYTPSKKRFGEENVPAIGDLSQPELLVNFGQQDLYSSNPVPAFMMGHGTMPNLPALKQEDTSDNYDENSLVLNSFQYPYSGARQLGTSIDETSNGANDVNQVDPGSNMPDLAGYHLVNAVMQGFSASDFSSSWLAAPDEEDNQST